MFKKIAIMISLILVLMGCTKEAITSKDEVNIDQEWIDNTKQLLKLSYNSKGTFGDFANNIRGIPNIFETFYLLQIKKNTNSLNDSFHSNNLNYLQNYNFLESKPKELVVLFEAMKTVNVSSEELEKKIEMNISELINNIGEYRNLTDEDIEKLYLLSESRYLLTEDQLEQIGVELHKIESKIKEGDDEKLLRVLYPIYKIDNETSEIDEKVVSRISKRVNSLIKKEYVDFWEVYQLLYLVKGKVTSEESLKEAIKLKLDSISTDEISNMQMLYILEITDLLNFKMSDETYDLLDIRISNSQILTGGFRERTNEINPLEFSFFSLYIYKAIAQVPPDYDKIMNAIYEGIQKEGNINWRHIYSYLQFTDNHSELKEAIININVNQKHLKALAIDQKYYFFKTMQFLNIEINEDDLRSFQDELITLLEDSPLDEHYTYHLYYSDLVKNKLIQSDEQLNKKIIEEIKNAESVNGYYMKSNLENLLSTFFVYSIDDNLNLGMINNTEEAIKKWLAQLEKYKNIYGGYSLIENEESDLYSTTIGLMLKDKLSGKQVPILF
ncbi:hypothetical protein ABEW19_29585 [Paenibacillus illinoisensis]|uniref:hypothetical protein n=1 Tax=Paenibacillus illinoisensis TaxID=59845 RepID=UPI003D2C6618